MKFRLLHISDLHYKPDWHEECELICHKFLSDISHLARDETKSYLVFSGDLVKEGAKSDYYEAFISRFSSALAEAGFERDVRICVPGNHDVSQDYVNQTLILQKGVLSQIRDERTFNDNLMPLTPQIIEKKFEHYKNCEKRFASFTACQTVLGGGGWTIADRIGVYCLNTALTSFGGARDQSGNNISDLRQLMIDTRSLNAWLAESKHEYRILVMHHPIDWLCDWAAQELSAIISASFHLVLSGHVHRSRAVGAIYPRTSYVDCSSPPLFTRKSEILGYSDITIDTEQWVTTIRYRQWAPQRIFVVGSMLSGTDDGTLTFRRDGRILTDPNIPSGDKNQHHTTLEALRSEFDMACTYHGAKRPFWVSRHVDKSPETLDKKENPPENIISQLAIEPHACCIRAPKNYGLTALGIFLSYEVYRNNSLGLLLYIDASCLPNHRDGTVAAINARLVALHSKPAEIRGFILDNWSRDKACRRALRQLKEDYPEKPIILLEVVDDCERIADAMEIEPNLTPAKIYFLWALDRAKIRELVALYLVNHETLDEDIVTKKVVDDIDALNIPRTPANCLMLLKLAEQAFDDCPVNRTEMIGRFLYLLFHQFSKIPRYATRPDLKDCEYALGYFCEYMLKEGKREFAKSEFVRQVEEYCKRQLLDLDIEILFSFLLVENIFAVRGSYFAFRFNYWYYYFIAHRMHHDDFFAKYILNDERYAAFPEVIEFYAGIDRRRTDAIEKLTSDLGKMNASVLARTGIPETFNPMAHSLWTPSDESVTRLLAEVKESAIESSLPPNVKDAIADESYDRAKPYHQGIANFINESTMAQLVQAMKGAARALRNSDHVAPEAKAKLLSEVLKAWVRVCQILMILSPVLAKEREASFEGMGFYLDESFNVEDTIQNRWRALMICIVDNVVTWFQNDIFSRKMGSLFSNFLRESQGSLPEAMLLLVMIRQKAPGWERETERFIIRESKNSFYLSKVCYALRTEYRVSFSKERTRQEFRRLAAMAIAKHSTGVKHPNNKLVERAAKVIDES